MSTLSLRRLLLAAAVLAFPLVAEAAPPVTLVNFKFHDLDRNIVASLGYDTAAAIVFFKEIGAVTPQQTETMENYEPIGCYPFYVLRNGTVEESGFHCRSFFCVGFMRGPKQCRTAQGEPYGGVTEMNNRLSLVTIQDTRKYFTEYDGNDRSAYMRKKINELSALHCSPFYVLKFDVAVGEGYACDELGSAPYFSPEFNCVDDWRVSGKDETCSLSVRDDELVIRRQILEASGEYREPENLEPDTASGAAMLEAFPDVIKGYYGYTAITELSKAGVLRGYPDGTFKPLQSLNRAELSKMIIVALKPEELQNETGCFPDVADEWYASPVCAAKRIGWLKGYDDGSFRPTRTMSKAEGIKVVVSALTSDTQSAAPLPSGVGENEWYSPYVRKAVELRLLLEPTFLPKGDVSRADAAVWLYRAMKMLGKVPSSSSSVGK